ncbi:MULTISPECIES: hypothetical protein [unclassified Methylobacterium]|uniref:hypothetical protein n=1 Tax=unclassified Methylobacterium TaxID=2615210 RepID=UPI0011C1E807|nr:MULTISPECIES: hypothetical protein [unclassified Methylobacterium]QEE41283.1 hypothetical protein FVA80_22285 [Methylobacterium sp. WL1]TXN55034.1 hypothetical protein FV241_21460 [Methylobacterium sp. WL2]
MKDEIDLNHQIVVERLIQALRVFAHGLGLDENVVRHIVNRVITDMPLTPDEDRMAKARDWMLIASA